MFEMLMGKNSNANDGVDGVKFIGEVETDDFITGDALASKIGLTAGASQYSNEPWLHFTLDGKTLYVAKKTYRHNLSWNHINAANAVFGSRTVEINGLVYKVRLLKSVASGDVYTGSGDVYDPSGAYGSEWNRLFYPIHSTVHTNANNPSPVSGEGIQFGSLAQYTDTDLLVHHKAGSGSVSWCQETPSTNAGARVYRGHLGVSHLYWGTVSILTSDYGWRPVLELVE